MGCTGSKHDDDPPVKSNAKSKTENEQSVRNVAHQNNRTSLEKKVEPITASVTAPVVPKDSPIKADAKIKPLTFKEVMEDKEGRAYFMKFLQGEHAEENLVFFEVRSYDDMYFSSTTLPDLFTLCSVYVAGS